MPLLLQQVAGLLLILLPLPASSNFDCTAGAQNWQLGWSATKQAACCQQVGIGCTTSTSTTSTSTTRTTTTITTLFDCVAGLDMFYTGWSSFKQDWCCNNMQLGCTSTSSTTSTITASSTTETTTTQTATTTVSVTSTSTTTDTTTLTSTTMTATSTSSTTTSMTATTITATNTTTTTNTTTSMTSTTTSSTTYTATTSLTTVTASTTLTDTTTTYTTTTHSTTMTSTNFIAVAVDDADGIAGLSLSTILLIAFAILIFVPAFCAPLGCHLRRSLRHRRHRGRSSDSGSHARGQSPESVGTSSARVPAGRPPLAVEAFPAGGPVVLAMLKAERAGVDDLAELPGWALPPSPPRPRPQVSDRLGDVPCAGEEAADMEEGGSQKGELQSIWPAEVEEGGSSTGGLLAIWEEDWWGEDGVDGDAGPETSGKAPLRGPLRSTPPRAPRGV
mmetsp:Transcript_80921/g.179844  ORF Transcript_80921/g.179844 Transcript_80921/m.179844 type:complete len:446 (+) Transcript_80921:172-1509(+)